jgi:hypothetical protein
MPSLVGGNAPDGCLGSTKFAPESVVDDRDHYPDWMTLLDGNRLALPLMSPMGGPWHTSAGTSGCGHKKDRSNFFYFDRPAPQWGYRTLMAERPCQTGRLIHMLPAFAGRDAPSGPCGMPTRWSARGSKRRGSGGGLRSTAKGRRPHRRPNRRRWVRLPREGEILRASSRDAPSGFRLRGSSGPDRPQEHRPVQRLESVRTR